MTESSASQFPDMSAYERRAWDEAVKRLNAREESSVRRITSHVTGPLVSRAASAWKEMPMHADIDEQVQRAVAGLLSVTLEPAMNTVSLERVEKRLGLPRAEFRSLDLKEVDKALPFTRRIYTTGALVEGTATALAVTGAEVATTVSGGATAGVAIGAVAVDIAASIVGTGRIVALVAAQYGYDVQEPEEEVFALGVLSVGSAGSPSAKVAALTSLSRLTQQMMRRPTWAQLNKNGYVKIVQAIFKALNVRLTHQKLAQAIPFVGVLINGGMSAEMADRTYRRARDAYRLRFLSDKYGIDPSSWIADQPGDLPPDDALGAALDELASDTPLIDVPTIPTSEEI